MSSPTRRHPPPVPNLLVIQDGPLRWRALVDFLRHLLDGFSGAPGPHGVTHMVGGSDPFGNPSLPLVVTFDQTDRDAGTGPTYMRHDAQLVARPDDMNLVIAVMVFGQ
jgi:hypothetical protein